jgi:NAD(P)H-hydrate epimerase
MPMTELSLTQEIEVLFRETGSAHHRAYQTTNGADPEWPLWYATYLHPKLNTLLNTAFTKSELVSLLVLAAKEQARTAPGADWASYYAQLIVQHVGGASENSALLTAPTDAVPALTTAQVIEVDRAMIEDFHIELQQMMENAGRNLAHVARTRFLDGDPRGKRVVMLAGTGGNGGGALVCARRLHTWGAQVQVLVTKGDDGFAPVAAHQLDILRRMHVPIALAEAVATVSSADLIIDGIIGYSLSGAPRGAAAELIRWANAQGTPILALDAPSGVDTTTGAIFEPAIRATATMTLALPKSGLRAPGVEPQVGELYLADISVPPELYTAPSLGLHVGALFAHDEILRLR